MNGKYLKYALGEIILVVIGILIALSISNWNDKRKSDQYELVLLQEISNAIESDIQLIDEEFIRRTKRKDSAVQALKKMVIEKPRVDEQELIRLINQTSSGFYQRYTSGPYESIKSNGLDKIKNDSLRALLVSNYDENLPARMEFIHFFNEEYRVPIAEARKALIGNRIIDNKGKPEIQEFLKVQNILASPILFDLLKYQEEIAAHALFRLENIKRVFKEMNQKIKAELNNRN